MSTMIRTIVMHASSPRRCGPVLCALALALVALPSPGRAQVPESSSAFAIDAWEPGALPTFDLLNIARSRVPGHLVPALSLQLGWAQDLLELAGEDPRDVSSVLVEQRLRADLLIAFGLFDRLAVSVHLPGGARSEGR